MPWEVSEWDCNTPQSRSAAGVVGMGMWEEFQCKQEFKVMPDPPCCPGITLEKGACVDP